MRRIGTTFVALVFAAGFYLLLIDTVDLPELYAGCGVAVLAAVMFDVARRPGLAEAAFASRGLHGVWRVVKRLPTQIAVVCWEALEQAYTRQARRGVFRAIPFDAGGEDPHDVGRRALAEARGSLTPNTIVIGIDPERKLLLVHQLHRQGGREELDVMRLG